MPTLLSEPLAATSTSLEKEILMETTAHSESAGLDLNNIPPEHVSVLVSDPEFRQLAPGSDAYKAAYEKRFSNRTPEESAPSDAEQHSDTKTEAESVTTAPEAKKTETVDSDDELVLKRASAAARKRIDQLTHDVRSREEALALRERRIAELEAGRATPQPTKAESQTTTQGPTFDKPKPKLSDFANHANPFPDFTEAMAEWTAEKQAFNREVASRTRSAEDEWNSGVVKFKDKGLALEKELSLAEGDFDHIIISNFRPHKAVFGELLKSEFGHRIAFDIASDEELNKSFTGMDPVQQLKLIGGLEREYANKAKSKTEATKKPAVSGAPTPPPAVKGGTPSKSGSNIYESPEKIGWAAYNARRAAERAAAHKGRGR